jgi:hypothetical protein
MLRDAESAEHQDADTQTALPFKSLSHPNATLRTADASPSPRIHKLRVILQNIPVLCGYYHTRKLCATMGTDSTSRPGHRFGMGLAYPETLPLRARRELNNTKNSAHLRLPLHTDLLEQTTYDADDASRELSSITILLRKIPGLRNFGRHKHIEWIPVSENTQVCNQGQCSIASGSIPPDQGNIVTLGGNGAVPSNNFLDKKESVSFISKLFYLNTNIANILRFIIGFIPAMIVFLCTQQGLMAWLGAPLWFFISGLRNILQSVLGNGGLHRSSVLHWKSFVSWSSMYVSLMYNGLSVILLEAILRVYILKNTFHITSAEYPFLVFFILVFTCGIFKILTHVIRGLSAKNIFIDILCTLLSFPVALFYHLIFTKISFILYNNALFFVPFDVFIVKLASDTVIGIINGLLDKEQNLRRRTIDYQKRLHESLNIYSRLEVLFPEKDVLSLLSTPDVLLDKLEHVAPQLKLDLIINALDLMYFWFYQPRANHALLRRMRRFSKSERLVIFRMQQVLVQERQISQLMVDGLVGKNFAAPLSFYLARSEEYLNQMKYICLNKFA